MVYLPGVPPVAPSRVLCGTQTQQTHIELHQRSIRGIPRVLREPAACHGDQRQEKQGRVPALAARARAGSHACNARRPDATAGRSCREAEGTDRDTGIACQHLIVICADPNKAGSLGRCSSAVGLPGLLQQPAAGAAAVGSSVAACQGDLMPNTAVSRTRSASGQEGCGPWRHLSCSQGVGMAAVDVPPPERGG